MPSIARSSLWMQFLASLMETRYSIWVGSDRSWYYFWWLVSVQRLISFYYQWYWWVLCHHQLSKLSVSCFPLVWMSAQQKNMDVWPLFGCYQEEILVSYVFCWKNYKHFHQRSENYLTVVQEVVHWIVVWRLLDRKRPNGLDKLSVGRSGLNPVILGLKRN